MHWWLSVQFHLPACSFPVQFLYTPSLQPKDFFNLPCILSCLDIVSLWAYETVFLIPSCPLYAPSSAHTREQLYIPFYQLHNWFAESVSILIRDMSEPRPWAWFCNNRKWRTTKAMSRHLKPAREDWSHCIQKTVSNYEVGLPSIMTWKSKHQKSFQIHTWIFKFWTGKTTLMQILVISEYVCDIRNHPRKQKTLQKPQATPAHSPNHGPVTSQLPKKARGFSCLISFSWPWDITRHLWHHKPLRKEGAALATPPTHISVTSETTCDTTKHSTSQGLLLPQLLLMGLCCQAHE